MSKRKKVVVAVTIGVIVKRALELLLSNEKGRKFLLYTVCIIIVLLMLPFIAIVGFFGWMGSEGAIDLENQVIENLPIEQQEELQGINSVYESISNVFTESELTEKDTALGKALFMGYLFTTATYDGMVQDLADCFINETADVSVYDNFEDTFGVTIDDEERAYLDEKYRSTS